MIKVYVVAPSDRSAVVRVSECEKGRPDTQVGEVQEYVIKPGHQHTIEVHDNQFVDQIYMAPLDPNA